MKVTIDIREEDIDNLLCSAFEGGSNYWVREALHGKKPRKKGHEGWCHDLPLYGGTFIIVDDDDGKKYEIGQKELKKGLQAMAKWDTENGAHHFGNIIKDNIDAETGDAFLQACCFGKLIYG